MVVFEDTIKITEQEDGSYTMSIALSDATVVVKVISKSDLEKLYQDIEVLLKEE